MTLVYMVTGRVAVKAATYIAVSSGIVKRIDVIIPGGQRRKAWAADHTHFDILGNGYTPYDKDDDGPSPITFDQLNADHISKTLSDMIEADTITSVLISYDGEYR